MARRLLAPVAILALAILFFCTVRQLRRSKAGLRLTTAFTFPQLMNNGSTLREWLRNESHALLFGDQEMTERAQVQVPQKQANVYASREDFHSIFNEDLKQLYQLPFLLTRDTAKAEPSWVVGLEECVKGSLVFREWARSWARRVTVQSAIRELKPRPIHFHSRLSNASFSVIEQLSSAPDRHFVSEAVLSLEDFERFVFIMSVLEHDSEHDCAPLLGCSIREIRETRARAFTELMDSSQENSSHNQPIVREKK